ncbi:MAG: HlyD family efflux transporter periplasmic adaptor subunit [Candidatus Eremiobacteraeota bacterium]|nr:HlyD family efflux transporter periplasmic adaptor subunit [Candidatus Eremiobacteraeota bacterium]
MYVRNLRRPTAPPPPPAPRPFPWSRLILIALIVALVAYLVVPRFFTIRADGLVEGDLIPVAPLFRARIQQKLVGCGQQVRAGQPLAIVTNFLLEGDYTQNYERTLETLKTEEIAQSQGLQEAMTAEAAAEERYQSALYEARKLQVLENAYSQTYQRGAIGRVAYDEALANWKAAQSQAESLRQLVDEARQRVNRVQADNAQRVAGTAAEADVVSGLRGQVHSQPLGSPVSGRVVDCAAEPLAIVDPGTAIYKIFAPRRSYILGFFNPADAQRLYVGESASIAIPGVDQTIKGNIAMIYPTIQKLPEELTKYFWQHEQWSQYRPIKIVFTGMDGQLEQQLAYGAQVSISIPRHGFVGIARR